ncbi:dynamin-1-like protein [Metopolophium dirhodum]|uniref:dynamin-1-like protein n=1 Tax=Metopolophium dirhodum TaxID=44670 RepID=UPI00298FE719|nr:dynamin-1-like protein [Metopolophium dirhodum]
MDSLIMVMNKLQDVFSTIGSKQKVDLPQIIVVGSQSSGKSSVLESLVGKSFLPRGTGIVTRAPLVLHLIQPTEYEIGNGDSKKSKDYATFLHKPGVIYNDFNKVRKEIEIRTEELTGGQKNITDSPIVLNIYCKLFYNLSFVDLPGLTKVPVGGQPKDIEQKIRDLVLSFIKNPNSIILAVVTANTDPATSESLHIAKSVDPSGDRTIAVVTKIDIMDAGTDATELLSGEVIPVKLGIIGVINRSQKDINDQKTIENSLKDENTFFDKFYPDIAQNHGSVVLGKQLEFLLIEKIKETCPKLKAQLYEMNNKYEHEVKKYKEFTENYDRSLLDLITQTATSYKAGLDGRADLSYKGLNGGATIAKYFKTNFNKDIDEIDPLQGLSPDIIINVINNASGTSMGVFMPTDAFDHLVKKQIQLLEAPSLACVTSVHDELTANIHKLDDGVSYQLKKYPKLFEKVNEILLESLAKYKLKTSEAVSKLIEYQKSYVNTDHVDFIESITKSNEYHELFEKPVKFDKLGKFEEQGFAELPNYYNSQEELVSHNEIKSWPKNITLKMRKTVEKITTCAFSGFPDSDKLILESRAGLLTLFIKCYFMVIKKIIQDTVPKTIMYEMVNKIKDNFQKDLISKVYKSSNLNMAELLLESKDIEDERIKALNRYDASTKALKHMREIEQICLENES